MKKIRRMLVGTGGGVSCIYVNGALISRTVNTPFNYSTLDRLIYSQGNPYSKIGNKAPKPKFPKKPRPYMPRPPKPRKPRKPYLGKHPKPRPPRPTRKFVYKGAKRDAAYQRRIAIWAKRTALWYERNGGDIGGPFVVHHVTPQPALHEFHDAKAIGSSVKQTFDGTCCATQLCANTTQTVSPSSDAALISMGTIGIAKALPTNPLAGFGQFLGELHQLPTVVDPLAWKSAARDFKRLAEKGSSEYLNAQFGWVPFLNDIFDFTKVSLQAQKHITNYDMNSGKNIRRSRKILTTQSASTPIVYPGSGPVPTPATLASTGTLTQTDVISQRVWFSGCFTYYLPPLDGSVISYYRRYSRYAQKLFGVGLDPHLLWQLAPWSWASDWFLNTGSVIRNWSAFSTQGLVMRYGYVMEEKTKWTTYSLDGYRMSSCSSPPLLDTRIEISRVRLRATPYGFGLNPASFTPFQNSIIAALGINRASRWL